MADITKHVASTLSATLRQSKTVQPPCRVQAVVAHQQPEELYRLTERVALYPALHLALLALALLSAVLSTCLPPSLMQKPARSLPIDCERELQNGIRDRGSGNCIPRLCLASIHGLQQSQHALI